MEDETPRDSRRIDVDHHEDVTPLSATTSRWSNGHAPKALKKKDRNIAERPEVRMRVLQEMFRCGGVPSFESYRHVKNVLGIAIPAVHAIVKKAFEEGHFSVSLNFPHEEISRLQLADKLKTTYGLSHVLLVPGNDEMLKPSDVEHARSIHREIRAALARRTATYLDEVLARVRRTRTKDRILLGCAWGFTMQKLAAELRNTPRPFKLPNLEVVPIIGATGISDADGVEASTVTADIARCYGGHASLIPCPAFVDRAKDAPVYMANRQVMQMLAKIAACRVVVTGMGPIVAPDPKRGHTGTRLVNDDAMFNDELALLAHQAGAIAEICYWLVNAEGKEVTTKYHAIGLGFEGLRRIAVNREKHVILVTGGDRRRIEPLRAILRARMASILVTDATTGAQLAAK